MVFINGVFILIFGVFFVMGVGVCGFVGVVVGVGVVWIGVLMGVWCLFLFR